MRKFMQENDLKEIAERNSAMIAVRTMDGGNSRDKWRKATKRQRETLYGLIYGALLGLNCGEKMRNSADMEQAVVDATEFQAQVLMRPLLKDGEELQGYMCIYIPLKKILAAWEQA
jgi:hypothetical protein